jgi:hypothetical protein
MPSGRWNIWEVGIVLALFAGFSVAARELWTIGSTDIMGVLLTCVVGFVGGVAVAAARNWFVGRT